jgi:hypothetical protein
MTTTRPAGSHAASVLVAALEHAWTAIRARHPQVPEVVMAVASGSVGRRGELKLGHFAERRWRVATAERPELFVGGEGLAAGAVEVLGTLLHEAAHGLAATREIQDTSRQGRYHNRRYATLAGELGLTVQRAVRRQSGRQPSSTAVPAGAHAQHRSAPLLLIPVHPAPQPPLQRKQHDVERRRQRPQARCVRQRPDQVAALVAGRHEVGKREERRQAQREHQHEQQRPHPQPRPDRQAAKPLAQVPTAHAAVAVLLCVHARNLPLTRSRIEVGTMPCRHHDQPIAQQAVERHWLSSVARLTRSSCRAKTRNTTSDPSVELIGSQNQIHRSSRPPSSRPSVQASGQLTSSDATTNSAQRRNGARSVACARPTAMAATCGSGWPMPRRASRVTSRRVRRSSRRQAWIACRPRGTSIVASPLTLRDCHSYWRGWRQPAGNLAHQPGPPRCDRSFPQQAVNRALSGRGAWSSRSPQPAWRGTLAHRTDAGPTGKQDLQPVEQLPQAQADAAGFGWRSRSRVKKPCATETRVTWWCQPGQLRPSKWSSPRAPLSSR